MEDAETAPRTKRVRFLAPNAWDRKERNKHVLLPSGSDEDWPDEDEDEEDEEEEDPPIDPSSSEYASINGLLGDLNKLRTRAFVTQKKRLAPSITPLTPSTPPTSRIPLDGSKPLKGILSPRRSGDSPSRILSSGLKRQRPLMETGTPTVNDRSGGSITTSGIRPSGDAKPGSVSYHEEAEAVRLRYEETNRYVSRSLPDDSTDSYLEDFWGPSSSIAEPRQFHRLPLDMPSPVFSRPCPHAPP